MAKYKIIPSSRTIMHSPISIGHKTEKGVEAIEFDLTAWVETYGSGTLTVIMRRWGDVIPYPIALEIGEDNKATWTLSDIDTAKAGMAYAQLNYIVGDEVVKKSDIYTFRVMDSLTGEGEPPEAYDSWLEHLTHLAAEAMAEVLDIESIVTDKTLTVDGGIADAKAAGDALALKADQATTYTKTEIDALIDEVEVETDTTLSVSGAPADAKKTGDALSALKADLGALQDGGYVADQQKIQEKIDDWLEEHPEATTTVQDESITEAKLASAIKKKIYGPFYNVQDYGIIPDTGNDLYDSLFDFLHEHVSNTGGIVYFPGGEYIISDSIFIPPNTIFMGSGASTKIKFTEQYASFGVALSNGGSNVGVLNMTVDCSNNTEIYNTAMTGSIGFGTRVFSSWTTKHQSPSEHASCNNVFAYNIWTNTRYVLQTETSNGGGTVTGVTYKNIFAKNSLVSIMARDAISDVTIENVTCSVLRLGSSSAYNVKDLIANNVKTGRVVTYGECTLSNVNVLPSLKHDAWNYNGAIIVYGKLYMNNCIINASEFTYAFYRLESEIRLNNVVTYGSTTGVISNVIGTSHADFDKFVIIGSRLETSGTGASIVYGRIESTYFPTLSPNSKLQKYEAIIQRISANDDLNDYKNYGKYYCVSSNVSSVSNVPGAFPKGFYFDVITQNQNQEPPSNVMQKITSCSGDKICIRYFTSETWGKWYVYSGEVYSSS